MVENIVVCGPYFIRLCQEIEDFFLFMKNSEEESGMRAIIFGQIKNLILMQLPDAEVESYGSYRTGLYLLTRLV